MHVAEIISGIACEIIGDADLNVEALCYRTSAVKRRSLFFCISGRQHDSHDLALRAIDDGAIALVVERKLNVNVPQIVVDNSRVAMALMAKNFYRNACNRLKIICVVGTNGKTSTTYLCSSIFAHAGYKTAIMGTNGVFIDGKHYDTLLTTPDPIELHQWFALMEKEGVKYVFLEASAHAIALGKLEGIRADLTAFTNFSQDHLDFFADMKQYAATKSSFFTREHSKVCVVNADDALGREIISKCRIPIVTYGYTSPSDVFALDVCEDEGGISYTINTYDDIAKVTYSNLHGKFNVYNTLCAATVARVFGIKLPDVVSGILAVKKIDGRNETVYRQDGCKIVIDFAHTPDGIDNILSHLKKECKGRLIVVFGCGGNRDRFKRPIMAQIVCKYADYCIVTSDNPRFEPTDTIMQDVCCGLTGTYAEIIDRTEAIQEALAQASYDDTIAILGKGAEKYQEIKGRKYPYNDYDTVKNLIN